MLFWANTIDEKYKKIHQMPINVQHLMYNLLIRYFSYGKIPLISSAYTNFRRATIYAAIRNVQSHSFFTLRISMNALLIRSANISLTRSLLQVSS